MLNMYLSPILKHILIKIFFVNIKMIEKILKTKNIPEKYYSFLFLAKSWFLLILIYFLFLRSAYLFFGIVYVVDTSIFKW